MYLSFNAPHERVEAPKYLKNKMKELHPEMSDTRIEFLAAVRAMDMAIRTTVEDLQKLDRETLVFFQSDNGASILDKIVKDGPRGCNYPYRHVNEI